MGLREVIPDFMGKVLEVSAASPGDWQKKIGLVTVEIFPTAPPPECFVRFDLASSVKFIEYVHRHYYA